MNPTLVKRNRAEQAQYISTQLLPQIALLTRLLIRDIGGGYSWTEAGLLKSLSDGPRRITELAELEGLAQPTTTLLVKRLEQQGLVRRQRQADDERVVLVSLTDAGSAALEHLRALASTALLCHLDAIPDDQLNALGAATDAFAPLIAALLNDTPRRRASP
jgi:DNA-binding MarR family transcriptional regulator